MSDQQADGVPHDNVERFEECECESPAGDPIRFEFPGGEAIDMMGCLECGGLVEWSLEVDYSVDEITPDDLPGAGECNNYYCSSDAEVVVQLRRDLRSITAYCEVCWEDMASRQENRMPGRKPEILARVVKES